MAKTIQYDINETFRGSQKEIYRNYLKKSQHTNKEIKDVYLTSNELFEIINYFYIKSGRDPKEESKKGILKQIKIYLRQDEIKEGKNKKSVFFITPLINLLKTDDRSIEDQVLYLGLLEYTEIFRDVNEEIFKLLGANNTITRNKDIFIRKIVEEITYKENKKPRESLSSSTINNNVRRSIDNLIKLRLVLNSKIDKSLEENQIRIRRYLPDYRIVLILYLKENKVKNKSISSLETIINEYKFVKYFFMDKNTIKESLQSGLKKNLFTYHQQIGDAIKVNFNEWQISEK